MAKILRADCYRMYAKKWLWLCTLAMMALSAVFCIMQHTAMDYEVSLDRVVFLPMSFYGVMAAALIGIFVGDDFSDGVIRNKIVSGITKRSIYFSTLLTCCSGGIVVYLMTIAVSLGIGVHWFQINVTAGEIAYYAALGFLTCLTYCSVYSMLAMLIQNKTHAIAVCMILSFGMLFLSLHTNSILVQTEYESGVLNPHFVNGLKKAAYEFLHDLNPTGQAVQLSMMQCLNTVRYVLVDVGLIVLTSALGSFAFRRKDIK